MLTTTARAGHAACIESRFLAISWSPARVREMFFLSWLTYVTISALTVSLLKHLVLHVESSKQRGLQLNNSKQRTTSGIAPRASLASPSAVFLTTMTQTLTFLNPRLHTVFLCWRRRILQNQTSVACDAAHLRSRCSDVSSSLVHFLFKGCAKLLWAPPCLL